jgi:hypothetical protein
VARTALSLALAGLVLCAPSAYAQESDVARGTATRISGAETTTYEIEAVSGPLGENAAGLITRTFTGPFATSTVVADVTCLAVEGNRAVIIGEVRTAVGIDAQAVLIRIEDLAPAPPPPPPPPPPPLDRVSFGVDRARGPTSPSQAARCSSETRSRPSRSRPGTSR